MELVVKLLELRPLLAGEGERMDVVEEKVSQEELAQEGTPRPLFLAGLLRDPSRLLLTRGAIVA
jgi:hypothetical protein